MRITNTFASPFFAALALTEDGIAFNFEQNCTDGRKIKPKWWKKRAHAESGFTDYFQCVMMKRKPQWLRPSSQEELAKMAMQRSIGDWSRPIDLNVSTAVLPPALTISINTFLTSLILSACVPWRRLFLLRRHSLCQMFSTPLGMTTTRSSLALVIPHFWYRPK